MDPLAAYQDPSRLPAYFPPFNILLVFVTIGREGRGELGTRLESFHQEWSEIVLIVWFGSTVGYSTWVSSVSEGLLQRFCKTL